MPKIILGVSGGVSAYKSISLTRLLIEAGHDVTVVPTPSALNFVGKPTWEAITGKPVYSQVFEATDQVAHVKLARSADLIIVAPATADLLFRAASGAANDMLSAILLTATCKTIYFPAMHSEMWLNPATSDNVEKLRNRGNLVVNPATGPLARGDEGIGRLPEPEQILRLIHSFLAKPDLTADFKSTNAVVTLGGTTEAIDPVRVITNRSTGEMGAALCRALYLRGANVSAVVGNHDAVLPHDIVLIPISTASELADETRKLAGKSDLIVMAAAVSDFTVQENEQKINREGSLTLNLSPTEDILSSLVATRTHEQYLVGFAAQTQDVVPAGIEKLHRKGCDLLVANKVGTAEGFGNRHTQVHLITASGVTSSDWITKDQAAHQILDEIAKNWANAR